MSAPSILPLRIEELTFVADQRRLVDAIGFTLPAGGLTAVIGPNGAGKSLLLRLCHGLLTPSSGHVGWALPGGVSQAKKRHAMVFQRPVMLRRSARANLEHALSAAGVPRGERQARADAALTRFGLAEFAERPARLMSGGEQQRLAIARAAAMEPEVIFLDEPTSALDPAATRHIEAMLAELQSGGETLVMTTHDLNQARRLARRVLFLHKGRLIEDAPAAEFFATPRTREARAFLSGELLW